MPTDYTELVTSQYRTSSKFLEAVTALTKPLSDLSDVLASMHQAFDVDTAVGVQLDAVGMWAGISRHQQVPVSDAFFTWNDTVAKGWNSGSWKGPFEPTQGIVSLDDHTYRAVIKGKIGSNYWDGTNEGLEAVGSEALANLDVSAFVIDNFDMTVTVYIIGAPSAVLIEMIKRGVVPPKPAGVRVTGYILSSEPGAPFFALSVPTTVEVAGLDFGSFGVPV